MNKLYLLGYPLGHSVSPQMQNAALAACGLADWRYEPRPLRPRELRALVTGRGPADWAGANVTIPYKRRVIPWLDELSDAAREIGAVNTLIRRGDRLIGDNTDGYGLLQSLRGVAVPLRGARVVILGAGGAAHAAAWTLAREGVRELVILNRTPQRGRELANAIERRFPGLASVGEAGSLPDADLVIHATSVGMSPRVDESPLAADARVRAGAWVIDLVYNPAETRLMREAAQMGAHTLGGLEMLVHQGACAFEKWTGRPAPVEIMREAARLALGEEEPNPWPQT